MVSGEEFKVAIFLNPIKCNGRVAEWLKAPDSKSEMALFAMFDRDVQSLIRPMFTRVSFTFAISYD
jgi:hypothetical protein